MSSDNYELYPIREWFKAFAIHEKIRKRFLEFNLKFIITFKMSEKLHKTYTTHYGFKKKIANYSPEKHDCLVYLIRDITKKDFVWFMRRLKKGETDKKILVVLNGKKREFFRFIPEEFTIIHKHQTMEITPKIRMYDKRSMKQKLEKLIDSVNDLPIKPLRICGFGSFFRDKAIIGDVDLIVEVNPHDQRWLNFNSSFDPASNVHYDEFRTLIANAKYEEEVKSIKNNRKRIVSLAIKCEDLAFQGKIKRYNIDLELLRYCTWSQLNRGFDYQIGLDFFETFKRMFIDRTKGFRLLSKQMFFNPNFVLLWSPQCPSFQKNYQNFVKNLQNDYIFKEYAYFIEEIEKRIGIYKNEGSKRFNRADTTRVEEYKALLDKYPNTVDPSLTYKAVSAIINKLREELKKIERKHELEVKKIVFSDLVAAIQL